MVTPSFTVVFDRDSNSATFGKFILTDTTDYAGNGIALTDVVGYFLINYPVGSRTGSFASPDINADVSLVNNTISLPLDSYGEVQKGTYGFQYFVQVSGAVLPGTYQSALITFDANTPFCDIPKAVEISAVTDCFQGILTATNVTDYGVFSATREMTVYPPQSLSLPNYTVAGATLTYNFQYDNVSYQIGVNDLLTYTLGIFTVTYRATGMILQAVNCDINLCRLRSCLNKYLTSIENKAKQVGGYNKLPTSVLNEQDNLFGLYIKFQNSIDCSKYDDATRYYNQIADIVSAGGCNCGCSDNDEPNPFVPISQVNNTVLLVEGVGIAISSVTVGETTTYTISLSNGYQTIISGLQSDVTTLDGAVTALQSAVTTLQGQVAAIDPLQQVVYSLYNQAVPNTNTLTTMAQYTAAIGSLTNGSELVFEGGYDVFLGVPAERNMVLLINGVTLLQLGNTNSYDNQGDNLSFKLHVKKQNNTTIYYEASYYWNYAGSSEVAVTKFLSGALTVSDLSSNTLVLTTQAKRNNSADFTLNYATVKKYTV